MLNNPTLPESSAQALRSTLVSRNVTISGHRTSIRLEPEMWSGLSDICRREGGTLHDVSTAVAMRKSENTSLTAAIRVFVMAYFRVASTEEGHTRAGHGCGTALSTIAQTNLPQQPQGLRASYNDGTVHRVFPAGTLRYR